MPMSRCLFNGIYRTSQRAVYCGTTDCHVQSSGKVATTVEETPTIEFCLSVKYILKMRMSLITRVN